MIYSLLGEVEVRDAQGHPVELPRGHHRTVLAMLLVRANHQVSTADLVRAGWGEGGVSNAQLYKAISALRKLLDDAGHPDAIKTANRFGYLLQVSDEELDTLAFQRLVERADAARIPGHGDEEVDCLRAALALWRGPDPLANVSHEPFRQIVESLKARRRRIAVRLFTLENRRGEHAAIVDDLHAFVAEDPAQGELCRQLMFALYRSGHRLDAIDAYERHVEALDRATGGPPEASLRALNYAMINDESDVVASVLGVTPEPEVRPDPMPRQLPAAAADFVGRADLLAEVTWLLRRPSMPVLVISGPGGIGKTALALRAAHDAVGEFPDGQLWAELRGTAGRPADPSEVLARFLRALGVGTVPESLHERATLYRSLLSERRVLIVLDDAASGTQVRDLVPASTGCVVLITARRRLPDIPGGVHHVAPLEPFDHVVGDELFRTIVAAGQVDLAGQDADVEAVVRMCGGLPLALRIAAALRIEDFHRPTADLRRRLDEHGPAAFEYGDKSLSRTLGAGLAPLDKLVRRLFLLLGLPAGPTFGEWTAAALLGLPVGAAGDALSQLAAISMIEPAGDGHGYRFHDLTREYARRRAEAELPADERAAAELRVLRALLTLVRKAHAAEYSGDFEVVHSDLPDVAVPARAIAEIEERPQVWFERERANVRSAVERAAALGEVGLCWDLAVSSHEFYTIGDWFEDWRVTHEVALAAVRSAGDRRAEGVLLAVLGQPPLVASGSRGVSGVPELEEAVQLLAAAGENHGLAIALRTLGNALRRRGELTRPLMVFQDALEHYRAAGDTAGVLQTLRFIGQTYLDLGDLGAARDMLRQAEAVARELGRERLVAQARYWAGQAALALGDLADARAAFGDVRAAFPERSPAQAYAEHGFGDLAVAEGDPDRGRRLLAEAESLARAGADVMLEGRIALSVAGLEKRHGEPVDQLVALLRAVARFQACGAAYLEIRAQGLLADAYDELDDVIAAVAARERIEELCAAVPPVDRSKR
ncbi:BTAD domain-containing putative transcriptional regulator [Actinoplanes sp. NBRC 103695]|uniref:BTAD domain-containing putative transcriptional regulator n=1 Tax=Actinoplanes sp. NBRC 103695 TaxID=3032202 RepID=UPI00255737B9|nr:BTAD domain-containing putative transcriptional regulator [Actinoplanes sp. NBRC 103695]